MRILHIIPLLLLISCGGELINPNENSEENPEEVNLTRQNQLTERYDCNGKLASSKVETINSVSKRYEIKPKDETNVWSFSASNGSETKGSLQNKTGVFTIDMAPTLFNIRVYSGKNTISYIFRECDDQRQRTITNDDGTSRVETYCAHTPTVKEQNSLYFNVNYKVETVPGKRVILRGEESCKS